MRLPRAARRVFSTICWIAAVVTALLTAGAFAGGGILCQSGENRACHPQTWVVVLGVLVTLALGFAGAKLYTPPDEGPPRKPWEYQ